MDDSGQAFPCYRIDKTGTVMIDGLTKREWYAGMALTGVMKRFGYVNADLTATDAFNIADAMLKESSK